MNYRSKRGRAKGDGSISCHLIFLKNKPRAVEKLGRKKVWFLCQKDVLGKAGLAVCKQRPATSNLQPVAEFPAEPTSSDLSSQILQINLTPTRMLTILHFAKRKVLSIN